MADASRDSHIRDPSGRNRRRCTAERRRGNARDPFRGWQTSPRTPKTVLHALMLGETTTFPTGTSAGGFTWTFDDTLHVPVRRSRSFGPMFAERPFTTGKGKLNLGAAFQHTTFSSIGGRPLTDLETSSIYASGNVYRFTSSLDVQLDRTIVSATYGLHHKVDVAAIVPFGRSNVSGFASSYQVLKASRTVGRWQRLVVRHRRHPASNEGCAHREGQLRRRHSGGHPPANG